jgi:hypothetical protein
MSSTQPLGRSAGPPGRTGIAPLIGQHVDAADGLPGAFANADIVEDFGIRMRTGSGLLDHIRE